MASDGSAQTSHSDAPAVVSEEPLELPRRRRFDSVAEAERLARRALPHAMYDRLSHGSDESLTLANNLQAFREVSFRPRGAAVDPTRSTQTTVLGEPIVAPILLGPIGALRLQHPSGGVGAIEAAARFGTICVLSPAAGHPIQELVPRNGSPLWTQITTGMGGRDGVEKQLAEAARLGYRAAVVTIDSGVPPKAAAIRLDPATIAQFAPDLIRHPRWTYRFVRDGMRLNVANAALGVNKSPAAANAAPSSSTPRPVEWDDVRWVAEQWKGPVVVKGILTAEDARRAVDLGAAAVIVSNHGGMALDGARATLESLPEVVSAVGGQVEVLVDGGIRTGQDVAKALALGARAVLLGRAYVMGLAVGGAAGAERVLHLIRNDLWRTLGFLGCGSVDDLGPQHVSAPQSWSA